MPNIRRLSPVLRVGQRTSKEREFQLTEDTHSSEPLDLQDADSVTLTMEHDRFAYTAIENGECTITDTEYGTVRYDFSADETSLKGRYKVQFEVEWDDGSEELYPPVNTEWVLDVGGRIPDKQPIEFTRVGAEEATFGNVQVDDIVIGNATISEVIGDPDIDDLSVETIDAGVATLGRLEGGIVGDDPLTGTLYGPGLTEDNGDLAVNLELEGVEGLTNPLNEHIQGNGYDIQDLRTLYSDTVDTEEATFGDWSISEQEDEDGAAVLAFHAGGSS